MIKAFVMHGIGRVKFYNLTTGVEELSIVRAETASWTFSYEEKEVAGGDALDIYELFETGRSQSIKFVDTEFDVQQLQVATGKKATQSLSVPIFEVDEGFTIPASGPYTYATNYATAAVVNTTRVQFDDTWNDFAPVPYTWAASNVAENTATATFLKAATIKTRIVSVTPEGIESVATAQVSHVMTGAYGLTVTMPDFCLAVPAGEVGQDANIVGFNVYVDDGVAAEYKSNATPLDRNEVYDLVATPGAGAGAPDTAVASTGQFTVAAGVITFHSDDAGKRAKTDYYRTSSASVAEVTVVDVLTTCLRGFLKAIWSINFRAMDNSLKRLEFNIFKCKYSGDYVLDANRADAAKHTMEFKILDPIRSDKKIVTYKILPLAEDPGCN